MPTRKPDQTRHARAPHSGDGRAPTSGLPETSLLEALFLHGPMPVAVFGADGHLIQANAAYEQMFGTLPPPAYDLHRDELLDALGLRDAFNRAFAGETCETPIFWYDPKALQHVQASEGARKVALRCTLLPVKQGGQVVQLGIAYRDVTAELTASAEAEGRVGRLRQEHAALAAEHELDRRVLEQVIDQTGDGIIMCDERGLLRVFNAAAARQHGAATGGATPEDWSTPFVLMDLQERPLQRDQLPLYRALHGEAVNNVRIKVRQPTGAVLTLEITATPLTRTDGSPAGAVLVSRDVTAQEHVRQQEREAARDARAREDELQRLFAQAPIAIVVVRGPEHRFILANPYYTRLMGGRILVGRTAREALPELEGQGFFELLDRVYRDGEPFVGSEVPTTIEPSPGAFERRYFNFTYQPTQDREGRVDGILGIAMDVTDQVRARERMETLASALRHSEQRYRSLVEATSQIVWTTTASGEITGGVETWTSFTGQRLEEAQGAGWLAAIHPDDREPTMARWKQALTTQTMYEVAHRVRRSDGEYRHMLARAVPILQPDGAVREWVGVHLDRTDSRRAELNLELLSDISRILSESMDPDVLLQRAVDEVTARFATFCAVDVLSRPEAPLERRAAAHRDPKIAERLRRLRSYPAGKGPRGRIEPREGDPPYVLLSHQDFAKLEPVLDPERRALLADLRPRAILIVPLKARGESLGLMVFGRGHELAPFDEDEVALADELARRTSTALENARLLRDAQEAIRLRDEFLSVASHELKTPLTPLALRLQSLARDARSVQETPFAERVLQQVEQGRRQVMKLAELIDDLLDVSRISAGRLTLALEPLDFGGLVREVATRFESEAVRAHCSLEVQVPAALLGHSDRNRLDQVVSNLLSNAIKYGAGRPVHVVLTHRGENAVLSVRDEGIGIEPGALQRIFAKYERAVSERNYGGLGLGLYISRTIVEALGGEIAVQSTPGAGATFTVTLPLKGPGDARAAGPGSGDTEPVS